MKTKSFVKIAIICLLLGNVALSNAQVTIGSNKAPESFSILELISSEARGFRLPQISTAERNAMQSTFANVADVTLANGLVIYNTDNDCVEYWNGSRWISICEGNSQMAISPAPCQDVSADGTGCDGEFTVTDPDCETGPFSFTIVAGADFAFFAYTNEADGVFNLSFTPNNSINSRSIVVRVTSSCTGLFKDFLFMQDGQTCDTDLGDAPLITSVPAGSAVSLCSGGAVYLSVPASTPNLDRLVWTRNNIEIARGVNYLVVTQSGVYDVSMGFVGCGQIAGNAVTVAFSGTSAPNAVATVISENGGIICGAGASVKLTAMGNSAGVIWFKDGVLSEKIGNQITLYAADAGDWMAVVSDGGCYSLPSNVVTVVVNTTSSGKVTLNAADVLVNGQPINMVTSFCPGSSLVLSVNNPQAGVTYHWYDGTVAITSPYIIPADKTSMLLRLVATDNSGALCPAEANSAEREISGSIPLAPVISGSSGVCSGQTTRLNATDGADEYEWFLNNVSQGLTTDNFFDTGIGNITVRSRRGSCWSPLSAVRTVFAQSAPVIAWQQFVADVDTDTDYTFSVHSTGVTAPTNYTWSATPSGNAEITGSGASVSIRFTDDATISITPFNHCGSGISLSVPVTVINGNLPTPGITPTNGDFCNAVVFTITRPATDWTDAQWSALTADNIIATRSGAVYSGDLSFDGTNYYYSVAASSTSNQPVTINFTGSIGGINIEPLASAISGITVRITTESSFSVTGRACFDIVFQNEGTSCGLLTQRVANRANFNTAHTYTLAGTLGSGVTITNIVWSYDIDYRHTSASDAVVGFSPSATNSVIANNSVNITFNPALLNTVLGDDGIDVIVTAIVTTSGGACGTAMFAVTRTINIRDCVCCGSGGTALPMQIGNNIYDTHLYMTNGVERCWMVQNSREGTPRNTGSIGANNSTSVWNQYGSHPVAARGYYYVWATAQTDACPAGWKVPSPEQFGTSEISGGLWTALDGMRSEPLATSARRFWMGNVTGSKVMSEKNPHLAGYRIGGTAGTWQVWGSGGYYWSNVSGNDFYGTHGEYLMRSTNTAVGYGFSVRCIKDQ